MDSYYSEYQRQSFYFQDPARYAEFPLYPDYDLDREQSLAERAVTLVTNNLTVANLWVIIPVILLVISIFLFAVLFAPSSLFRQAFSMIGLLDEGGAQSKDANSELDSSEIQNNSIDQNLADDSKDSEVDDNEETSGLFDSFPNFFSMVSDIRPAVETMTVPDILLSRNESLVTAEIEAMTSTLEAAPTTVMLQELYDASSLLRSFQ